MKKLILTLLIGGFIMTGAFAKTACVLQRHRNNRTHGKKCR